MNKRKKTEVLQGVEKIIIDVMNNLPHAIRVNKPMQGRTTEGEVELFLVVRFESVDRFSVAYISRLGDFILIDDQPYLHEAYEPTDIVTDFSRRFGWIDDMGHVEPLNDQQKVGVKTVAESVVSIFSDFPSSIYLQVTGGDPSFSLDESDGSRALFSTVDVLLHNGNPTWTYVMMPDDGVSGFLVDSINRNYEKANSLRIKSRFFNVFGLDLDFEKVKRKRNGPFSVSFIREDIPMAPDALGISHARSSMFFERLEQLNDEKKSPFEAFETLSDLCMSKEELFFVGWLLGSIEMKAFIDIAKDNPLEDVMETKTR